MKSRFTVLIGWTAALTLPVLASAQISDKSHAEISAALPKYDPGVADKERKKDVDSSVGRPAPLSDDPLITMPTFEVTHKATTPGDELWLTKDGKQAQAYKDYKNSLTALEWALNWFNIPLLTPSAQSRADEQYRDRHLIGELQDLGNVVNALSKIDPAAAKSLSRELDIDRHPEN
ncbi:MAG TPA: hypothetical protein VHD32_03210 [Candidatus Didemnitutus sp.]|nr:hypothetical protein [Candidatus Didemnitutus sp.]